MPEASALFHCLLQWHFQTKYFIQIRITAALLRVQTRHDEKSLQQQAHFPVHTEQKTAVRRDTITAKDI